MRLIILISLIFISLGSCAMGQKPDGTRQRKLQDKMFRPCQDSEVSNPIGKLCNRSCVDKTMIKKKCKDWKVIVKDFNDPETFKWFRAGSFILIDEDQLF